MQVVRERAEAMADAADARAEGGGAARPHGMLSVVRTACLGRKPSWGFGLSHGLMVIMVYHI